MSNQGSQARSAPRRKSEDRRSITPAILYAILSKQARGGSDLQENDPRLAKMACDMAELQKRVRHNELVLDFWRLQKERNTVLAGALRTVLETIPSLYEELGRSASLASSTNDIPAEILFKGASNMIVDLGQAAEAVEGHWLLMHPDTQKTSPVMWDTYAEQIIAILRTRLPEFSIKASHELIAAIVPDFSGEKLTYSAVKTHLQRKKEAGRHPKKAPPE